jgi:hypothetical protein
MGSFSQDASLNSGSQLYSFTLCDHERCSPGSRPEGLLARFSGHIAPSVGRLFA